MTVKSQWTRVTKKEPCVVCSKCDWCTYSDIGSCCMRVESKVPMKNGGYLHRSNDAKTPIKPVARAVTGKPVTIDAVKIWRDLKADTQPCDVERLATLLKVGALNLERVGTVWIATKNAWGFPMRLGDGRIVGFRIRNAAADKWSWPGSKAGIFTAGPLNPMEMLYVVEGPTSLAAILTLGLSAIGRPSCAGQEDIVNEYIKLNRVRRIVIIADNDPHDAGLKGAGKLQETLHVPSVLMMLPQKDVRAFLIAGGTKQDLENVVRSQIWTQPN